MKRWLTRILVCLILALVTTVGVAWGIVFISADWIRDLAILVARLSPNGPGTLEASGAGYALTVSRSEIGGTETMLASGWPALALESDGSSVLGHRDFDLIGHMRHPLWTGIVVDTVVFTLAWVACFTSLTALKRGVRRMQGRCPQCAYDLRRKLATGCPECGWNRSEPRP